MLSPFLSPWRARLTLVCLWVNAVLWVRQPRAIYPLLCLTFGFALHCLNQVGSLCSALDDPALRWDSVWCWALFFAFLPIRLLPGGEVG